METTTPTAPAFTIEIAFEGGPGPYITWNKREVSTAEVVAFAYDHGYAADTDRRTEQFDGRFDRSMLLRICGPWQD
jgi:hypothetical protein